MFLLAPGGYAGVVFVFVLLVVVVLNRVGRQRRGGKYSAAMGNALMHVEPIFRPSRQHIIEARQHEECEQEPSADPPDTSNRHSFPHQR